MHGNVSLRAVKTAQTAAKPLTAIKKNKSKLNHDSETSKILQYVSSNVLIYISK